MVCPRCGATVADPDATFCSRCGAALGAPEAEVTAKLDEPPADGTEKIQPPRWRLSEAGARWLDAASGAGLAFMFVLCVGTVLLLAGKLQFPQFGAGADPIEVLSGIVVIALGSLRAPIHVGDLVIVTLPLGALAASGWGIAWAAEAVARRTSIEGARGRALVGLRVGVVFGLACMLAALAFRFRTRPDEVFAGAIGSLVWGTIWGVSFSVLGASKGASLRAWARALAGMLGDGSERWGRGIATGIAMVISCGTLAAVASLLWIIGALLSGVPSAGFGPRDAIAALFYLAAFAPNVLVAIVGLGMGAAVDVGARVTIAGADVGAVRELSLLSWEPDGPPALAFGLVLIPLLGCLAGGWWGRRTSPAGDPRLVLGAAAVTFAVILAVLAALGEARLGAGLLGRGVARLSVHPISTFVAALLWGMAAGGLGWKLAARRGGT